MKTWDVIEIGASAYVTDYVANGSFASLKQNVDYLEEDGFAILVRTRDYNNGWSGEYIYVNESAYQFLGKSSLQPGDIVICNVGSVGTVFRVPDLGRPMTLGPNAILVRFKNLENAFFYYYFLSVEGQGSIASIVSGSAQPKFNKTEFRKLTVPLPPLPTQRKIAAVLSAYDDLIENNTQRVRLLEDMARALYREWFVEYRFPGHEGAEFTEDEQGRRPKGWKLGQFSDAAVVMSSSLNPGNFEDEIFEHFSLPAFDEARLPALEAGSEIKSNKTRVPEGCVLLPKLNPRIPRVWLPPAAQVGRQIASTEFLPLMPMRGYSKYWVYSLCASPEFLGVLSSMASGTSTSHQRIAPKALAILPLVLPPTELVEQFTQLAAPMLESINALRQRNANLRRTRDLLLPRLVSGELDVSGLDISGAAEAAGITGEGVA